MYDVNFFSQDKVHYLHCIPAAFLIYGYKIWTPWLIMCYILPKKYITSSKCSSDIETQISCAYVSGCGIHWEHTFYDPSSCTNSCTLLTLILIFVDREQPVQHVLINCILPCAMFSGLPTMWACAGHVGGLLAACSKHMEPNRHRFLWYTSTWISAGLHPPILRNWITSLLPYLEYSLPGMPSSTCTETLSIPATHSVDFPVLQFL